MQCHACAQPPGSATAATAARRRGRRCLLALLALLPLLAGLLLAVTAGGAAGATTRGDTALAWAKTQIGKAYQWGGAGPNAYDCSGLTMRAYEHAGLALPHSSAAQYAATDQYRVASNALVPGDLLFYGSSAGTIHHVSLFAYRNSDGSAEVFDAQGDGVPVGYQRSYGDYFAATRPYGVSAAPPPPVTMPTSPLVSSRLTGDFDGDGKADLAAFVQSAPNVLQLWVWRSTTVPGGPPSAAQKYLAWQGSGFTLAQLRPAVGDIDGDHRADIVALYNASGDRISQWVWRATGQPGRVSFSVSRTQVGDHPGWSALTVRTTMADLDADGRADMVAFVEYQRGAVGIWAWHSTTSPGRSSATAYSMYVGSAPGWAIGNARITAGDLDGDHRDDVIGFYDLGRGRVKIWYWRSLGARPLAAKVLLRDSVTAGWSVNTVQPMAADLDGDGKPDLAAFVSPRTGTEELWAWHTVSRSGAAPTPVWMARLWWGTGWNATQMMPFTGDIDNDGRDDIGAFYDYGGGHVRSWIFRATGHPGTMAIARPVYLYDTYGATFATRTMRAS